MKNILDLRKKISPQVQIVEKIIFKNQPLHIEAIKVFLAIFIVSGVVWGISKADTLTTTVTPPSVTKSFSILGTVASINTDTISLNSEISNNVNSNTFDTVTITTIQTQDYTPLFIQDIKLGDKVIIQGTDTDGAVKATRLISFSTIAPEVATSTPESLIVATSTATTTLETITSTSTAITSEQVTTPTTTPTTTEPIITATTTEIATSTPTIIENIVNTVQDVISNIIEAVTPTTSDPVPAEAPAPAPTQTPTPATPSADTSAPSLTS